MYKVVCYDMSSKQIEERDFETKKDAEFFMRIFDSVLEPEERQIYKVTLQEVKNEDCGYV